MISTSEFLNLLKDRTGTGEHPAQVAPIFSWTLAVFIDLAIQASQHAELDEGPSHGRRITY